MVPIVDGFNNNQSLIPLVAKSSEKKMNSESEKSLQDLRDLISPYGNLVDSHDSLADDFDELVPEYGFVSNAKPSLDHVINESEEVTMLKCSLFIMRCRQKYCKCEQIFRK
ncbi:hypothetical protein LguiA_007610 [Lonicera macranthoides]